MTIIKSVYAKGFKSFAKPTEVIFPPGFSIILGPNGSGKCLVSDSLIQLGDGSLVKIGELVENKIKENKNRIIDDGCIAYGDNTKIAYLDTKDLKIKSKPILAYIKRKSPSSLVKIITRSGRNIITTKYHPLFSLKEGKIAAIKAEELKNGVRIAVPRNLSIQPKTKYFTELLDLIKEDDKIYVPHNEEYSIVLKNFKKTTWKEFADWVGISYNVISGIIAKQSVNFAHLVKILRKIGFSDYKIIKTINEIKSKNGNSRYKMLWKNTPEFSRFFGYLLAEGRLPKTSNQIWFTNSCEVLIQDYKDIAKKIFGVNATINEYKPNTYDVLFYSTPIRKILNKFGMPCANTEHKDITNLFLSHSSDTELAEILNGLFCGDGYIGKACVEIVTKSRKLGFVIETMLTRLGITYSSKWRIKIATNSGFSGIYKSITIYGVENFKIFNEKIKLVHPNKRKRLLKLLGKKSNPNVDLIEINRLLKTTAKELGLKIKELRSDYPKLDAYVYNSCLPTRTGLKQLVEEVFTKQKVYSESLNQVIRLTYSDIFWDEIIEIEEILSKEKWVYDLSVEDDHNFIANNIIVHNSNIIDLITFVLGKSSAKEMRVERSANLIYNGGKDNEPASQAEASMVFDNSKKEFPVNTEEVKITRIVKKDGSSNYYLNDQKMNKQQILDVLSAAKIDPDGHNIVLQGDIIRFTQMKGEERRLIIEEISGISVYEDKKQKAMNELEKVQAKLTEIEIILAERDAYLRELRKEKTQAKRFRELQEEIKSCKATVLHTYLKEKHEKRDEIEKKINEQKEKITQIENKLTETKNSINEKELDLESTNKGIEEKGEKEQVELQKSIEATKSEVYKSTSRLEACELEIDRIKKRKEQLKENILDIEKRISEYTKEINNTEKIVNELKEKELSLNKSIEKMNDGPDSNISQISSEIKEIESEIDSSDKNLAKHLNLKQTLIMESNRLELSLQDITKKIIELQASSKEYETSLKAVDSLKKDLKEKGIVIETAIKERGKITYELESLRRAISKSMEKLGSVRAKQITIKNVLSNDKAVEKILSLNDKKVYGTISQLGIVPDEYALALEVCAGQRLKSIIVDNDLTASKCIDVLKTSKAGVATFLPLNKIKPREAQLNKFKSIQGVIGSAIDVITFDKKFKDVFQYIFGSTLLVKDVNTSRKVGIGRVRMVTIEGDLIETSGAMIGGFRSKSIGFQFSEQQLTLDMNTLEEEISFNKKRIDELETQRMDIENKVINLNNEKSVIEGEIIKLEKQDKPLNYEKFLNEKSRLLSELETKKEELNNLNNSISEYVKSLDTLKKKRSDLTIKLSSSGNIKIKDSLIRLQEEKSVVRERVAGLISQTESLKVQINSIYKPELDKTNLIIKQSDKELEQFILEINVLKDSLKNRKDELKDKEKKEKDFFAQYRELFTKRNKLTENIKRLNELYVNEEKKIKELGNRLNDLSIDRAKVVAEAEGIEKEFEEFNDAVIKRGVNLDELKSNIKDFEKELQSLGNVNMRALEIFETVEEEYNKIIVKVNVLKQEKDKVLELMSEIEGNKKEMFLKAFNVINKYFSEIFSSLSNKGEAYLEIENKEDIFNSGVDVRVRLLGSKFLDLNSLSGGEKTLTALSFIFAIQECDPASFYIMDEVDAALDKTNSTLLSRLLAKYSKRAQYIVVSHNDTVITEGDAVYGVSMQNGVSRVFSLKI